MPVPFLEGIWVRGDLRRQGIGRALIEHAAAFLEAKGFRELGSDSQIDNGIAHASHRGWGFAGTERGLYFRKSLSGGRGGGDPGCSLPSAADIALTAAALQISSATDIDADSG